MEGKDWQNSASLMCCGKRKERSGQLQNGSNFTVLLLLLLPSSDGADITLWSVVDRWKSANAGRFINDDDGGDRSFTLF